MSDSNPALGFSKNHKFIRRIQSGPQGYVEQWKHVPTAKMIAVKVIRHTQPTPNEVAIHREPPPHESIIGYLGYYEQLPKPDVSSLLLEFCEFGDFYDFGKRARRVARRGEHPSFSEAFMWPVYRQLMSALAFLHQGIDAQNPQGRDGWRPIVHQDIKVENVFVKRLGTIPDWSEIKLKIGDFGMSTYYDPANLNPHSYIGTSTNWSPEISWETKRFTPASDVWAAASIIHGLAHNFGPKVASELIKKKWFLQNDELPFPATWPPNLQISYWSSQAPHRVIPINVDPKEPVPVLSDYGVGYDIRALSAREHWPSPKYSDALNDCMMAGLKISPDERAESGKLLFQIETAQAKFLFKDLCVAHDRETASD
ncbi:SPS1 Serine threonine protein kinase [Pyrenophora tritici-repentis]|nr:SPS1 Serine-threonine protein kinase [Pyrenophora tritici-repentis]KAF7576449.1 SPS1, Serine-threonine protein kinase [Pyrenophora tritici-repentis]KAG9387132.1 SPS1 Serine-threonine protein kinase [Pyrenophora tritici-repentis]KAI0574814.1 SPS1 Serine-threonine protein kinase [Pyrenophora tritici-repentis]KAI0577907.1 SPS1 Serine-threonine protein kinase [Pyrenophora tritici-repentis]